MPGLEEAGELIAAPDNYPSKGTDELGTFFYDSEGNCGGSGTSTLRRSCEQLDKISSACSRNEAEEGEHVLQRRCILFFLAPFGQCTRPSLGFMSIPLMICSEYSVIWKKGMPFY